MDTLHAVANNPLNQPQHVDNKFIKSPATVGLIALGIILMIGGAVAAGVLYPHLGYVSFSCLSTIPVGIALIVVGVRCGRPDTRSSTSRSGQTEEVIDDTAPSTNNVESPNLDSRNVVSVGSNESRLNEQGIREELGKLMGRKNVEVLVIYGDGSVRFNTDPGFVDMNPKKVILVGARIIHAPCSGTRLDDTLAGKKEWLGSMFRVGTGGNMDDTTCVKQLKVSSIQEAIDHTPDKYSLMQRYHVVYRVNE